MGAFELLPIGAGRYTESQTSAEDKYAYSTSYGFVVGAELREWANFAIAISFRYFRSSLSNVAPAEQDHTGNVDLQLSPTIRFPLGDIELLLPFTLGPSFIFTPGTTSDGYGAAIGFSPGLVLWLNETFGLLLQVGYEAHAMTGVTEYYDSSLAGRYKESWTDFYHMLCITLGYSFRI